MADVAILRCSSCGASIQRDSASCEFCGAHIERDERLLSLICDGCMARNAVGSTYCRGCGQRFGTSAAAGELTDRACPACELPMHGHTIGDVAVAECTGCSGLWVPGEFFGALVDKAIERARASHADFTTAGPRRTISRDLPPQRIVYRKCPVCDKMMNRKNFGRVSGVIVDECRDHGTWLDADELEQIAGFIVLGGLEEGRQFERRNASSQSDAEKRAGEAYAAMLANERERELAGGGLGVEFTLGGSTRRRPRTFLHWLVDLLA